LDIALKATNGYNETADVTVMTLRADGNVGISQATFGTSAAKVFGIGSGTAPADAPANAIQMWSQDIQAGEAAPHFMTEHADIIKLYQQSHIADASEAHAITDPEDAPADADELRDDIVTNTIPSIESALNALGAKVNDILAMLENTGQLASA
jgi:hypothetical protein